MIYCVLGDKSRELQYSKVLIDLREKNPGINEFYFDAAINELDSFWEKVVGNSLFSTKSLIVLKRCEKIKNFDKFMKNFDTFNHNDKMIILDYKDEEKKLGKKARKAIGERSEFYEVRSDKGNKAILDYVGEELSIKNREAYQLIDMIGKDIHTIKNEINKIKNFLGEDKFEIEKVKEIVSINKEYNIFELIEQLYMGDSRSINEYLRKTNEHMMFLYMLGKDLQIFLKLKLFEKKYKIVKNYSGFMKETYPLIKTYISQHPYAIYKKLDKLNRFDVDFIEDQLENVLDVETKIKSGYMDEKTAIELLIVKFSVKQMI